MARRVQLGTSGPTGLIVFPSMLGTRAHKNAEPATRWPKFLPPPRYGCWVDVLGLAKEWISARKELVVPRPRGCGVRCSRPAR